MDKSKLSRFLVGGYEKINDKFHGVFEVHAPCRGGDHKRCVIVDRNVSPPFDTEQEAIDVVMSIKDESQLEGWEATGAKA